VDGGDGNAQKGAICAPPPGWAITRAESVFGAPATLATGHTFIDRAFGGSLPRLRWIVSLMNWQTCVAGLGIGVYTGSLTGVPIRGITVRRFHA